MTTSHPHAGAPLPYPDHDLEDEDAGPLEDNPIWQQENVALTTVGIDIGSSGTQLVFSELKLRRAGSDLATRYVVVERRSVYESPVSFTPFTGEGLIDGRLLGEIIDRAYSAAGTAPASVETGVVILTGEALRRENAEQIATVVSLKAGDFVCAAAGHHMEARLAAFGSGAVARSAETSGRILNVDIGGGTPKLSVAASGQVIATAALSVGGRLIVVDEGSRVVRLEDAGRDRAAAAGLEPHLGSQFFPDQRRAVAESMADVLVAALSGMSETVPYLTEPIGALDALDGVVFSGGVSEYLYGLEDRDFGDLGPGLAAAIADRLASGEIGLALLPAAACIRATALGASQFSVQLSGNTYFASDPAKLLPRRNLPVVRPPIDLGDEVDVEVEKLASSIAHHLHAFLADIEQDFVLALSWSGEISHARLSALGRAVTLGLGERLGNDRPILLALDADIAKNLGHLMRDELGIHADLLVLDGLTLLDFDYIDLGRPRQPSGVVPVTIKSLVF